MQMLLILVLNLIILGVIVIAGMIGVIYISATSDPKIRYLLYFVLFLLVVWIVHVTSSLKKRIRNHYASKSAEEGVLMK